MNKNHELVSIIIIAYNEEKYLPVLLESLLNQTVKTFEVIVVDSNSTDLTSEIAKSYQNIFLYLKYHKLNQAKGPAYARNRGAEIATFDRLIFLDADTRVRPDFIERILYELSYNKADVATCPIRISEHHFVSNIGAEILNFFMVMLYPVYSTAYGACLISTKAVHKAIGGFWEHLSVCEDCNYVLRARRLHRYKFKILKPYFYTSDRRAKSEGGAVLILKYFRIHLYRMISKRELLKGEIKYTYGKFIF